MAKYGKDSPERFIDGALDGETGGLIKHKGFQNTETSNEIEDFDVSRPHQEIKTPYALDNVGRVYDRYPTSMRDVHDIAGSPTNLAHSLEGASAIGANDVGAAGRVKKTIIPDH